MTLFFLFIFILFFVIKIPTAGLPCLQPKSILNMDVETRIKWTYWKNLKAFTVPPPLVKRSRKSSSLTSCLWDSDTKTLFSHQTQRHQRCLLNRESRRTPADGRLTGCWRGGGWRRAGRCSGSSLTRAS